MTRKKTTRTLVALGLMSIGPLVAEAQDRSGPLAAVEQMFEGMRTANPAMVREVFAADARFAVLDSRGDAPAIVSQGIDGWISAIGESGGQWDEQAYDLDVRVDGNMASIWAPYTFYLNGAVRHCGINSIELLRDGEGWKVTQLSDTRRTESCPDPLGGGE